MSGPDIPFALVIRYHARTEAFDRTLPHALSPDGAAIVAPWKRAESYRFAADERARMHSHAARRGIDHGTLKVAERAVLRLKDYGASLEQWAEEVLGPPDPDPEYRPRREP